MGEAEVRDGIRSPFAGLEELDGLAVGRGWVTLVIFVARVPAPEKDALSVPARVAGIAVRTVILHWKECPVSAE